MKAIEKNNVVYDKVIDRKEMNEKLGTNNVNVENRPLLTINNWCHNHIKALHKKYPNTERLAWCKIENQWNGHFIMVDMVHPEQVGVGTEVETTDDWMKWLNEYLMENWEEDDMHKWNCVLHSHHHMGCFWSWTDDKARLWLNDWRTLAWAVVTAYQGEEIDYKGCVNFYKPYNIEIDCDIEYEVDDLYWQAIEYGEFVKNRTAEIYNEAVKTDTKLNELQCEYDYTNVINYLWIDITQQLVDNARQVAIAMPTCKEFTDRLQEIMKEAKEKVQEELGAPIDNELTQRMERNDFLNNQLEKARVEKTYSFNKSNNRTTCFSSVSNLKSTIWFDLSVDADWAPSFPRNRNSDYDWRFTEFNYKTKEELINDMWFNPNFNFRLHDWYREVMNYSYFEQPYWEYVWDVLSELFDYEEDYLPRYN